jgi:hypothetical protein
VYPIVRIVLKALLAVTAFAVVVVSVCLCLFYFYSGDLPNFSALAKFAPDSPATVAYQCSNSPVQVIPSHDVASKTESKTMAEERTPLENAVAKVILLAQLQGMTLEETYSWFTEGYETADLQQARTVLGLAASLG